MPVYLSYPKEWQSATQILGCMDALSKQLAVLLRWRRLRDSILRVGRIFIVTEAARRRVVYYLPATEEGRALGEEIRRCGDAFTDWVTQ